MSKPWKCPQCGFLEGINVTYEETCDVCGSAVDPSDAVPNLEEQVVALRAEVERLEGEQDESKALKLSIGVDIDVYDDMKARASFAEAALKAEVIHRTRAEKGWEKANARNKELEAGLKTALEYIPNAEFFDPELERIAAFLNPEKPAN